MTLRRAFLAALALLAATSALAQLQGHGGPVRALAVSPDGAFALSGSFDQSAILWSVDEGAARQVLRVHEGAVNAVAALPDGRLVTAGEDGRLALWRPGRASPDEVLTPHAGPIAALSVAVDGSAAATASWDGTAKVIPLDGSATRLLDGHRGNVNGVALLPGGGVATAGYDGTLRLWPREGEPLQVQGEAALNALMATPDGAELVTAGVDGRVRFHDAATLALRAEVEVQGTPLVALAVSPDGARIAAASIGGAVAVIDRAAAKPLFNLVGPGLPVWSVAFRPGGRELLTGGADRLVRRWDLATGEHIGPLVLARPAQEAVAPGDRGAEVFGACRACHTLTPDGGNRAGPSLHGLFGRRIATLPSYPYSDALRRLDIVWTPETVSRLFEIGPATYTPGTKMPEQVVSSPADREALVRYLERVTR